MTTHIRSLIRALLRNLFKCKILLHAVRPILSHTFVPESLICRLPVEAQFPVYLPTSSARGCRFLYESSYGDALGRVLFWRGWEAYHATGRAFYAFAKSAKLVLDVGANTGVFTLAALAANPHGRAVAIEPVKRVAGILKRNIEINRWNARAVVLEKAASDCIETTRIYVPRIDVPCEASLMPVPGKDTIAQSTETCTIDSLSEYGAFGLAKIDVEGTELRVLRGMQQMLRFAHLPILLEFSAEGGAGEISSLLRGFGYRFFHLSDKGIIEAPGIAEKVNLRFPDWLCCCEGQERILKELGAIGMG